MLVNAGKVAHNLCFSKFLLNYSLIIHDILERRALRIAISKRNGKKPVIYK